MSQNHRSKGDLYVPELDGLRALSVIFVLLVHVSYGNIIGGFLGVDIFFVISGYIITRLLKIEYETYGKINLCRFYIRRAIRILPPLIICLALAFIIGPWSFSDFLPIALSALFFVANFLDAEVLGNLAHAWSLAIEEQFYFVWPAIFVLAYSGTRINQVYILISVVLIAILSRFIVLWTNNDPVQIYTMTLTRMDSLAIGCLLALSEKRFDALLGARTTKIANWVLPFSLLLIIAGLFFLTRTMMQEIPMAFSLFALLAAIAIYSASRASGRNLLRGVLAGSILRHVGKRSYGIYLYHYPIFMALESWRIPGDPLNYALVSVFKIILALLVAEFFWHTVEQPLLGMKKRLYSFTNQRPVRSEL